MVINVVGKKKNKTMLCSPGCFYFVLFSNLCEIMDNLTSRGLKQLFKSNHLRSSEEKSLFGGTTNNLHLNQELETIF